jgi:hypothetical protein
LRHTLVLLLALVSGTASAQDLTAYATWMTPFNRCDLHVAARAWSLSDADAEARLKAAVSGGTTAAVQAELQKFAETITATGWEICDYSEPGFSYYDAEQLASYWGNGDATEAKARIEAKLLAHDESTLAAEIEAARATGPAAGGYNEEAELKRQVFFDAGYDWCDAEGLAALWGTDFDEAKMMAADKINAGGGKTVKKAVKKSKKMAESEGCK